MLDAKYRVPGEVPPPAGDIFLCARSLTRLGTAERGTCDLDASLALTL